MSRLWYQFFCLGLSLLGLTTFSAGAHNAPGSTVMIDFHRDGVAAELTLPLEELETAFKEPLLANTNQLLVKYETALRQYLVTHVQPETDGKPWQVSVVELTTQLKSKPYDLVAKLWLQPPPDVSPRRFQLNYTVILHEVMSHSSFVAVRNDWDTAVFSGKPEPLANLMFTVTSVSIDRSHGDWWQGFRSVLRVGMHHIADGTDHLLFLLVLLLPAPLVAAGKRWGNFGGWKRSFLQLFKIVTAFTFGHSLTLLIGALNWVRLPSQPVEILIAFSIFVSALHAIRPWFAGREVFIAAGFGLIHGLAFAGSIAEYGFSPWSLAATVLAFNLGIEAMQLCVVVVSVPWLLLLARTTVYTIVRTGGATLAGLAAVGWILERAGGVTNPFNSVLQALTSHPWWLVTGLALLAAGATLYDARRKPVPIGNPTSDLPN